MLSATSVHPANWVNKSSVRLLKRTPWNAYQAIEAGKYLSIKRW